MMAPLDAYDGGTGRPAGDRIPFTVHSGRRNELNDRKHEMIGRGEAAMMPTSRTAMMRIQPRTVFKKMLRSGNSPALLPRLRASKSSLRRL